MAAWHDVASARRGWADAPADDGDLEELLAVAREACFLYVHPDATEIPLDVPTRYRVAQLMQARAIASKLGGNLDTVGLEGFTQRFVLGYDVRNVLVPPAFGELAI